MAPRRKGKFISAIHNHDINEVRRLLCTRQIPVNAGASYREHFIIECFKVNYRQVRITCRKEDEPKILEMLKLIVQHGADVNVRGLRCSPRGMTAAMIAADQGLERCLRFLVESGADLTITANSGDNALMLAARAGQVDCVKYITEHSESGSLLNQVNKDGHNALMLAAIAGQVDCVKYLTEHSELESFINQVNRGGKTALMMAASSYQDDHGLSVKCLVKAGADVNMQDRDGLTALMLAVERPLSYWTMGNNDTELYHTSRVQSLIKGEADLSLQDNEGRNALMIAIESNQSIAILKLLIENMSVSTLNQVDKKGKTALMMAASNSQDDHVLSVKFLVEAGADVNMQDRDGLTALMLAVERPLSFWTMGNNDTKIHHTSRVQRLIKGGADLSLQDNKGRNALMIAIERNQSIAILKLLTENMSVSTLNRVNREGQSALMMAASSSQDDHGLSVKCLVEAGADVNVQDRDGRTALMLAVNRTPRYWTIRDYDTELHHTSRVQRLIKGEADLSLQDNKGRNALMIAIERNLSIAMLKLLTGNMSVSTFNQVNKEGQTALMLAASNSDDDHAFFVKYLVEAGADLNVKDRGGSNALMMAASSSQDDHGLSVKFLVEAGADVNMQDRDGRTALMLAVDRPPSDWDIIRNNDTRLHITTRVQSLIKGESNLSLQDNIGRNALMIAIGRNLSIAILKLLIENMSVSTLNQVNKEGQTALMMAASNHNQKNAICLLIAAGADLNVTDTKTGYTALMCAIHKRNYMAATLLLEKGALVNTVSRYLETPLSLILFFTRSDKGMVTELLSRGLDPALSCRDQGILHTMVAEGEGSVVRGLVMNGFPPVDIKCDLLKRRYSLYLPYLPQTTLMSPLALALTCIHHDIARYLIVNRFFSRYDILYLCGNHELRQSLQRQIQRTGDTYMTRAKKCLEILDFLSARPLSLRDLCLVTISSALSQYLVRDPERIPPGDSRWMCQPTFKERVQLLDIPLVLKRELLHQIYSRIPCESWGDISLEEEM